MHGIQFKRTYDHGNFKKLDETKIFFIYEFFVKS